MEIKIGAQQILKVLNVLSWIIFVGLCIEAGGIIFNAIFTQIVNPDAAKYFWKEIDLDSLYQFDSGYFTVISLIISIVVVMKAIMFYQIIRVLHNKKLDFSKPFNTYIARFISSMAYLSLGIGLFSFWGVKYTQWLVGLGVTMPDVSHLRIGGADVWLFMCVVLFVIAQIVKRGIEIQTENELTI